MYIPIIHVVCVGYIVVIFIKVSDLEIFYTEPFFLSFIFMVLTV